jgi:hypothetical protein
MRLPSSWQIHLQWDLYDGSFAMLPTKEKKAKQNSGYAHQRKKNSTKR